MTEVIATVQRAAQSAGRGADPGREWNPVYRVLAEESSRSHDTGTSAGAVGLEGPGLDLVARHLRSAALLVIAVTDGERTRSLRIGLAPSTATLERADGEGPSHWCEVDVQQVPAAVTSLLEDSGIALSPAQLSIEHQRDALRLSPAQSRLAHAALLHGAPAEEVFASIPDLDEALRDALTATGPRVSLALTLHDPHRQVAEEPITWSRLWVRGRHGLYRLDQPASPALEVHPVADGDVLGSVLPVLEQGIRFAAASAASGGAR